MKPNGRRAEVYRIGYRFARRRLGAGQDPGSIRLAMERAQERLRALVAYSADLDELKRRGVEDALAGKPMDRRHAGWGGARARRVWEYASELLGRIGARWGRGSAP